MILPTKRPPGNPITDYQQKKKKERKKKKKKKIRVFLQAFTRNFGWISLSCIIYRTSTDHAFTD